MTILGTGLLWFGWFGFNAGSALGANGGAGVAFIATHIAASAGGLSWMVAEWVHRGKPTVLGIASGIISGLATITPAAGFVGPISAMIIGLVAGTLCYAAVVCKMKLGYDDSLDVVAIHGVGGFTGIVAVGLFASIGATGLFFGNAGLVGIQVFLALVTLAFSVVGTYIILKIVDWTVGLRITAQDEEMGLDLSQHNERAYS
jgi:Amt family ammonium transporter